MSEKLCIFCKHFKHEAVYASSGCPTCGPDIDGGSTCKAGHFYEARPGDEGELNALYRLAERCKDYERPDA